MSYRAKHEEMIRQMTGYPERGDMTNEGMAMARALHETLTTNAERRRPNIADILLRVAVSLERIADVLEAPVETPPRMDSAADTRKRIV